MNIIFTNVTQGLVSRGAESSTHLKAENLQKLGNSVYLFGNGDSFFKHTYTYINLGQKKENYDFQPTNFFKKVLNRFYLTKSSFYLLLFHLKAHKKIKKINPDVIITVNGVISILITKLLYPKAINVVHGHSGPGFNDFDNLRCAPDLYVVLSPRLSEYKKYKPKKTKLVYIPNGITKDYCNCENAQPVTNDIKAFFKQNKKVIFCPAALVPYKRVGNLVKAFNYLSTKEYFLLVAGDGPLKNELLESCNKILGEKNYYIGTFKKDYMPFIYKHSYVTVLPSKQNEAFGNVLLESMVCNTPVIANKDVVREEIVLPSGGELVNCGSPKKIANTIKEYKLNEYNPRKQVKKFDDLELTNRLNTLLREYLPHFK